MAIVSEDYLIHHYVYITTDFERYYIGSRTCYCEPEEDIAYFGSFSDKTFEPLYKAIIAEFDTRAEATEYEQQLILDNDFANNAECVNRAYLTPMDELIKQSISTTIKEQWQNGFYADRKSNSEAMKALWSDAQYKANTGKAIQAGLKKSAKRAEYNASDAKFEQSSKGGKATWAKLNADPDARAEFIAKRAESLRQTNKAKSKLNKIAKLQKQIAYSEYCLEQNCCKTNNDKQLPKSARTKLNNNVQRLKAELQNLQEGISD